jgi:diaminopimelate decarboxylase
MKESRRNGGCRLTQRDLCRAAETLPTPCYLYDEQILREAARSLSDAFSRLGKWREYFPVRLNCNPSILRILREEGCGALCSCGTELMIADRCGFSGREILYAPFVRDDGGERLALAKKAVWLIDGPQMLPAQPPEAAILCWNPGGKLASRGKAFASFDRSKFGVPENTVFALAQALRSYGVQDLGTALRVGANELDPEYYPAAAEALFALSRRMLERTGIAPGLCCLGSGLGYSCRPEYPEAQEEACAAAIAGMLRALPGALPQMELQTLVGDRLTAKCGWYLTRVVDVKERSACPLVLTDGGCGQFERLQEIGYYRLMTAPGKPESAPKTFCDVAGTDALHRTRFAAKCLLPRMKQGDLLAIQGAGAGAASETLRASDTLPCAEYLLKADGGIAQIGKTLGPEDFLAGLLFTAL